MRLSQHGRLLPNRRVVARLVTGVYAAASLRRHPPLRQPGCLSGGKQLRERPWGFADRPRGRGALLGAVGPCFDRHTRRALRSDPKRSEAQLRRAAVGKTGGERQSIPSIRSVSVRARPGAARRASDRLRSRRSARCVGRRGSQACGSAIGACAVGSGCLPLAPVGRLAEAQRHIGGPERKTGGGIAPTARSRLRAVVRRRSW